MSEAFVRALGELIASAVPIWEKFDGGRKPVRAAVLEELETVHGGERVVSSIEIKGLPPNAVVFKADAFPQPDRLFRDVRGVRKRADFILLADEGARRRVVFIEMKRRKASEHSVKDQLRGAACIMDYCKSVISRFWGPGERKDMMSGFEERYVSCSHVSAKNSFRRQRDGKIHDDPERLLKLSGHSFTYRQLIGK